MDVCLSIGVSVVGFSLSIVCFMHLKHLPQWIKRLTGRQWNREVFFPA